MAGVIDVADVAYMKLYGLYETKAIGETGDTCVFGSIAAEDMAV